MHQCVLVTSLLLALVPSMAWADEDTKPRSPIGCKLSPEALSTRAREFGEIFTGNTPRKELEDGYAFRFDGDEAQLQRLIDLIRAERECCQFFTFEIRFEPDQGPVWLNVRGSPEIKSFLENLLD